MQVQEVGVGVADAPRQVGAVVDLAETRGPAKADDLDRTIVLDPGRPAPLVVHADHPHRAAEPRLRLGQRSVPSARCRRAPGWKNLPRCVTRTDAPCLPWSTARGRESPGERRCATVRMSFRGCGGRRQDCHAELPIPVGNGRSDRQHRCRTGPGRSGRDGNATSVTTGSGATDIFTQAGAEDHGGRTGQERPDPSWPSITRTSSSTLSR